MARTVSGERWLQREYRKNLTSLSLSLGDREQPHYKLAWRKCCNWCSGKKILADQFHEGREYIIAGYWSVISAFHNHIHSCKAGDHPKVSALVKGTFNLKPPKPRYPFIWDVDQVLNYLNNLTVSSNLKNSTYKFVMWNIGEMNIHLLWYSFHLYFISYGEFIKRSLLCFSP